MLPVPCTRGRLIYSHDTSAAYAQGASTVLMAATAPELQGSKVLYWHAMRPAQPSKAAVDDNLAAQLWDASLAAVGWVLRGRESLPQVALSLDIKVYEWRVVLL